VTLVSEESADHMRKGSMTKERTAAVQPYLRELRERLAEVPGMDSVGVYLHGSAAMGAVRPHA
jgi:hypothetical protein